jgi:pyruvate,water dikinase
VAHAAWGLGETLVGGELAGDSTCCRGRPTLGGCSRASRAQARGGAAAGGGTQRQPGGGRVAPVFGEASRRWRPGVDAAIARDFVAPHDLEWVWDGAQFWLTQARPVTRRPHYTYAGLHGQPAIWTRGNTCEVMPEPLQAMDWNFSRRGCNDLLRQGWGLMGYPLLPGVQRAGLFDGRLYLEASTLQWEAWDAMGLPPERFNALMGGHQPAIATPPPAGASACGTCRTLRYLRAGPALGKRGDAEVAAAHAGARTAHGAAARRQRGDWRIAHPPVPPGASLPACSSCRAGRRQPGLLLDTLERFFPAKVRRSARRWPMANPASPRSRATR